MIEDHGPSSLQPSSCLLRGSASALVVQVLVQLPSPISEPQMSTESNHQSVTVQHQTHREPTPDLPRARMTLRPKPETSTNHCKRPVTCESNWPSCFKISSEGNSVNCLRSSSFGEGSNMRPIKTNKALQCPPIIRLPRTFQSPVAGSPIDSLAAGFSGSKLGESQVHTMNSRCHFWW